MSILPLRTAALAFLVTAALGLSAQGPKPPVAKQLEHLSLWHGEKVNDPWFWLRDKANPEVAAYLQAENAYTEAMTADLQPFSETLYKEMLGRIKQTDLSVPVRRGAFYYYSRTEEGKQYPIQCRRRASQGGTYDEKAAEQVILDQNELAKGLKFLGLGGFQVSDDDQSLLFSSDATGFRQYKLFLKDLRTGAVQGPLAERVTGFTWSSDNRHVFFGTEDAVTKRPDKVWRLVLPGGKPALVYEEKNALYGLSLSRTKDRNYIVVSSGSTDTWESRVLSAKKPLGAFRVILPRETGHKYEVDHRDGKFYIRTNKGAKNFRLVTAPASTPGPAHWTELIAHRPEVLLDGVELFQDFMVVAEKHQGLDRLRIHNFKAGTWRDLGFPEPVYAAFPMTTPEFTSRTFRFNYQSMVTPPRVYDCDLTSGRQTLLKQTEVLGGYDPRQ